MNLVIRPSFLKSVKAVASGLAVCALALTLTVDTAAAQGRHGGGHGGGWHRGGGGHSHWGGSRLLWGGIGLGIGIGAINSLNYYGYYGRPWYPGYVVVEPPVAYYDAPPVQVAPAPVAQAPVLPDPVIYPRNGQDASQTESDRRACNQWAMTQPRAMAEASVFHRATLACMEGRGYTVK